ncbi:hypothetical protein PLICRDRAFT_172324 [Plicaturopsis crispa FD-325 SS-3]|nr:hypothetical protein PLICRDRAFT_172324 [Plicaturopsis crispa FD-325 SS-3]
MSLQTAEQSLHDQVNLGRLVKRLEKSVSDDDWSEDARRHDNWLKAQRKVKFGRKLLKSVEAHDLDPTPQSLKRYRDVHSTLDRIEGFFVAVQEKTAPKVTRPEPILPKIPLPVNTEAKALSLSTSPEDLTEEPTVKLAADDLLLSPSDTSALAPQSASLLSSIPTTSLPPPSQTASATKSTAVPAFIQNSNALQQEMSEQLAQMATQLKRNAMHFSESLARDQAVVDEAQEKLEGNYDVMKKERVRLRDHRGKSGSTTCLVLMSMLVVVVAFLLTFFVIRLT